MDVTRRKPSRNVRRDRPADPTPEDIYGPYFSPIDPLIPGPGAPQGLDPQFFDPTWLPPEERARLLREQLAREALPPSRQRPSFIPPRR